jgi:hypothetical protein
VSPAPITRDWIATHASTVLHMHLNAGDRHVLTRNVVDRRNGRPIGISYTDTSYKRTKRNGDRAGRAFRSWFVDGHEEPIGSLNDALEILRIQRAAEREPNTQPGDEPTKPAPIIDAEAAATASGVLTAGAQP